MAGHEHDGGCCHDEPESIEMVRQRPVPVFEEWVCCMDCGVFVEPLKVGKKKWTICKACQRVYTQNKHPWIAKMLAERLSKAAKITRKIGKKPKVFECARCGKFYVPACKIFHSKIGDVCHWCHLLDKDIIKPKKEKQKCAICGEVLMKTKSESYLCQKCMKGITTIKKALEYTYYIAWQAKFLRDGNMVYGQRLKNVGHKLVLREDFK